MIKEEYKFLNHLSEINNNTGIKFLHRAACPGSHCPMHMALAAIRGMSGVSSLVVGMPECGYYSRFVAATPYGKNGELHYVYELDSNEVVFGCRKGVKNALLQMDREGAKIIVIIVTCVPALIGEDMKSVIEELETEMKARAVFIDGAHFKRNGYQSGLLDTLEQLVKLAKTDTDSIKENKINILGFARGREYDHLKEIVAGDGFTIEEFPQNIGIEHLNNLAKGQLNIVMNTRMLKSAKMLKKNHQVPYVSMADRYTAEDIAKGYEEIFRHLQIKNVESIVKGRVILEGFIKNAKRLKNLAFIGTYPEMDTLPVTLLLCSIGMIPGLLHVEEYDENSNYFKMAINELGQDPYITYITDTTRVVEVFTEDSEYLSLGNCQGLEADRIIENDTLRRTSSLVGYERSTELLSIIMEKLD